jgi:hypothetical protein
VAVTFLYQHQRVVKRDEWGEWIETSLEDIAIANELATELFGYSLDELSFPGRELLRLIGEHVAAKAAEAGKPALEIEWTRRELREAIHWTEARLRLHLAELARMEYVQPRAGKWGKRFSYRLGIELAEIAGGNRFVPGIKDVETLRREAELAGIVINFAGSQGHFARASDHFVGTSQPSACEVESVKSLINTRPTGGTVPTSQAPTGNVYT